MCRGMPRGCPAEVKVQKNLQSSDVVQKGSAQRVNDDVPTFHMVTTFLSLFSPEAMIFLHSRGLKSPSEEEWDI